MSERSTMLIDLIPLLPRRDLTAAEIDQAAVCLLDPKVADESKALFLSAWAKRGESASELAACAEVFLPRAVDPGLRGSLQGRPLLDCCGTGGGGLNLLNISTGLIFILGAMDIPVVKHGNRGITKKSGSADVLEALGLRIDLSANQIRECLRATGGAFLFAPAYHPAFAAITSVRRQLAAQGQRTIFNLLGPLLNPARPDARLVGVFRREHLGLYTEALEKMACPRFSIAYGEETEGNRPLGEVSAQGTTWLGGTVHGSDGGAYKKLEREPAVSLDFDTLLVSNASESAQRLVAIFLGEERGLGRETLLINAAVGAWTHGAVASLEEGLASATEVLDSGRVLRQLRLWQEFSRQLK